MCIYLQVNYLINSSTSLNKDIIPGDVSYSANLFHNSRFNDSYQYKQRYSATRLIDNHIEIVRKIQDDYLDKLRHEYRLLEASIQTTCKADHILGDYDKGPTDETNIKVNKDGTFNDMCAVCGEVRSKMRRHLKLSHPQLSDMQISFALDFSKKMRLQGLGGMEEENEEEKEKELGEKSAKRHTYQNTRHVNRRHNYKLCHICDNLYINISGHYKQIHKIEDRTLRLKYTTEATVIPKVLTKIVNGRPIKLTGTELEETEEQYRDVLDDETNTLQELGQLRKDLKDLEDRMSAADDKTLYESLVRDYDEKMTKFKSIRYKDNRTYSNQMETWRAAFCNHLQHFKIGNANSSKKDGS